MTETKPIKDQDDERLEPGSDSMPFASLLSQIITKIKDQPFLFVIAIAVLLVSFAISASGMGSADLRFIVIVIAVLAFIAILGYYWLTSQQLRHETGQRAGRREDNTQARDGSGSKAGEPIRDESSETDRPTAGKYQINAPNAIIASIGDENEVKQRVKAQKSQDEREQNQPEQSNPDK